MNKSDITRDLFMLKGPLGRKGYDWWWHSFTGYHHVTGEAKAFFVEYFIINPELGKDKPVFGQRPDQPAKPSYLMVKAGAWGENKKQLHAFYPIMDLNCSRKLLMLSVGKNFLSETRMYGEIKVSEENAKMHPEYMSDAGSMQWDLVIDKKIAFHVGYGASELFRRLNSFEMFWHAEGMKTEYSGTVIFDGEEYDVTAKKSYGYADKNWGSDFTSPWVWLSSCNMRSRLTGKSLLNSVINIGGGRPKAFGVPLQRKLLMDFFYEGVDYEYNFSKFWMLTKIRFHCYETKKELVWKIAADSPTSALRLKAVCRKKDMLLINYEAPNGKKLHNRLWNGGTGEGRIKLYRKKDCKLILIDDIDMRNIGCEYGEYDCVHGGSEG